MLKKLILGILVLNLAVAGYCDTIYIESGVNMQNFWEKNGKEEQKIISVATKIISDNKLDKRIPVVVDRTPKVINAYSMLRTRDVHISTGILPYFDNDDELAFVIAHEIAHSYETYESVFKINSMIFNSKKYENKADLRAIDYLVKSGYNPVSGIIVGNKIFTEPVSDWGFLSSHPKGSKRLLEMYKYIYVKYPSFLNSDMTKNAIYQNFLNSSNLEIKAFIQKQKSKKSINEIL